MKKIIVIILLLVGILCFSGTVDIWGGLKCYLVTETDSGQNADEGDYHSLANAWATTSTNYWESAKMRWATTSAEVNGHIIGGLQVDGLFFAPINVTATTTLLAINGLIDPTGAYLAIDSKGNVIATSSSTKLNVVVGFSCADYIVDGTADDVQIQEAIDYVGGSGGGNIFLKRGIYDISTTTKILFPNITLGGDGDSTILRLANQTNGAVIEIGNDVDFFTNVHIKNFKVEGNADNQDDSYFPEESYGIKFNAGLSYGSISGVWVDNTANDAIKIGGEGSSLTVSHIDVFNNRVTDLGKDGEADSTADGIDLDYASYIRVMFNDVASGFSAGTHDGVDLGSGSSNNMISYNIIHDGNNAGLSADTNPERNIISYNKIYDVGNRLIPTVGVSGIGILGGIEAVIAYNEVYNAGAHGVVIADNSSGSKIIGNTIKNSGQVITTAQGIRATDSTGVIIGDNIVFDDQVVKTQIIGILLDDIDGSTISNNTIFGNFYDGISIAGSKSNHGVKVIGNRVYSNGRHGIITTKNTYSVFSNNSIYNNVKTGLYLGNTTFSTISGNDCFNNQGVRIQERGIYEYLGSNYNQIVDNNCYGNSVEQITYSGMDTTGNNLGVVRGRLTATNASSTAGVK